MKTTASKTNRLPVFSERFRSLREKAAMTQKDFAQKTGLSGPTVGFYENGTRLPDAVTLAQIAQRCNVTTDWLVGLTDAPQRNPAAADALNLDAKTIAAIKHWKIIDIPRDIFNIALSADSFPTLLHKLREYAILERTTPKKDPTAEYWDWEAPIDESIEEKAQAEHKAYWEQVNALDMSKCSLDRTFQWFLSEVQDALMEESTNGKR